MPNMQKATLKRGNRKLVIHLKPKSVLSNLLLVNEMAKRKKMPVHSIKY